VDEIVRFAHANSAAKICLQLGHSGPKGSTKVGWEGYDVPLDGGNWPLMAASDVPWSAANQTPRPMTRDDMDGSSQSSSRRCGWASRPAST
jgi:anthraniloyl-CoA monooxygenase